MSKQLNIGKIRVYFGVQRMTAVTGVNSLLEDGSHFLMWDFDDVEYELVAAALRQVQRAEDLSNIYILSSGKPDCWHAYCFQRYVWREALVIVWTTPLVCNTFVKMGFMRGHFTLRFREKKGRPVTFVEILRSPFAEDVDASKVDNFTRYLTKRG